MWHMHFMQVPGLAEKLVDGRQAAYLGYFFHFGKFTPAEIEHCVHAYGTLAQLHAVFEMYRAFPASAIQRSTVSRPRCRYSSAQVTDHHLQSLFLGLQTVCVLRDVLMSKPV